MKFSHFAQLHNYTDHSILNSLVSIDSLIDYADKNNLYAVAKTDIATLSGTIKFYQTCLKKGIKPIIGSTFYYTSLSRFNKNILKSKQNNFLIPLLVKNNIGYENLLKLLYHSYSDGYHIIPRIDNDLLAEYNEGLFLLTGDLSGELSYFIINDEFIVAEEKLKQYIDIFGSENVIVEIIDNGYDIQKIVNKSLLEFAEKLQLKPIVTSPARYIAKEDYIYFNKIYKKDDNIAIDLNENYFKESYLKSVDYIQNKYNNYSYLLKNTIDIADKCNLNINFDNNHFPSFKNDNFISNTDLIKSLCEEFLENKFTNIPEEYTNRLMYELTIIDKMNLIDYFLLVWDIVNYAKNNNIIVGPGRGSAVSSLVVYCLKITTIDPIKNNLIFERFLNPKRISFPDIDIDIEKKNRKKVIDYILDKYENSVNIMTFDRFAKKQALLSAGKILDIPYPTIKKLSVRLSNNTSLYNLYTELKQNKFKTASGKFEHLFKFALKLEGLIKNYSLHPAGIIISNHNLNKYLPLFKDKNGNIISQYDKYDIEKLGFLKIDILGNNTLNIITDIIKIVNSDNNKKLNFDTFQLNDDKTYNLIQRGNLIGIFQFESRKFIEIIMRVKPKTFQELVNLNALYRPGLLSNNMIEVYIKNKFNPDMIDNVHPILTHILTDTYGILIFEEQTMECIRTVTGADYGHTDLFRIALRNKNIQQINKYKHTFIENAKKNNISEKDALKIFEFINKFAGYCFNKAHSTAYAYISYVSAYLKANYPLEFYIGSLNNLLNNRKQLVKILDDAKKNRIDILLPNINISDVRFIKKSDNAMMFGFAAIKNISMNMAVEIVKKRTEYGDFESIVDFCIKIDNTFLNKYAIESLIKSGAFDIFGYNRSQLIDVIDHAVRIGLDSYEGEIKQQTLFNDDTSNQSNIIYENIPEWDDNKLLNFEKDILGIYLSSFPLSKYNFFHKAANIHNLKEIQNMKITNNEIITIGIVENIMFADNNKIIFLLQDEYDKILVIADSSIDALDIGKPVMIRGFLILHNDNYSIKLLDYIDINKNISSFIKTQISIDNEHFNDSILQTIKDTLKNYHGTSEVELILNEPEKKVVVELDKEFACNINEDLIEKLVALNIQLCFTF